MGLTTTVRIIFLVFVAFVYPALAFFKVPLKNCSSCLLDVPENQFEEVTARNNGSKKEFCIQCVNTAPRCDICTIPVLRNSRSGDDSRPFCADDFGNGIFDSVEAQRIAYETTREL